MRLDEEQAYQIYERSCRVFPVREHPLAPRQVTQLIMGTDRMQRHTLHILRQAEKKQAKRLRAEREKRVRPIVRFTTTHLGRWAKEEFEYQTPPPTVIVRIGDDTETYEPEALKEILELQSEWAEELLRGLEPK